MAIYVSNSYPANSIGTSLSSFSGAFLGSLTTTIAVLAVGAIGFLMLSGRMNVRRAARVLFGCFIVFGAAGISRGIFSAFSDRPQVAEQMAAFSPQLPLPASPNPQQPKALTAAAANPFDPYGANKPQR